MCYQLTQGMLCTYMCVFKLACQYDTGSGVVIKEMDDLTCGEPARSISPFATQLYWSEARNLFRGDCVHMGAGQYMSFSEPLDPLHWPDCSSFGEVAPGEAGGPQTYEADYTLQFYQDLECREEYQVSTYGERPTSRFTFKLYRGAQHCYDMVDVTPRGNVSSRDLGFDMLNFRFVCGNVNGNGNGIMIEAYDGPKCTGRVSAPQTWAETFYPMNYPDTIGLVRGNQCTRWGRFRVKMEAPFGPRHLPDCEEWACTTGACAGGTVRDADDKRGQIYDAQIRSSGGSPEDKRSLESFNPRATSGSAEPRGSLRHAAVAAMGATVAAWAGAGARQGV